MADRAAAAAAPGTAEFTGERVIPGQVNDDLWSEHVARYAFAARLAAGRRVLDAGCGTGYGTAELAAHAQAAVGIDIAPEAVAYAAAAFPLPNARFAAASCSALPFPDRSFDLVTAFEVIEHLGDYRALVAEAARVLAPGGCFVVSTPNRAYYSETRSEAGPNPFHAHEFDAAEFHSVLAERFAHVSLMLQNRSEAFVFHPAHSFRPAEATIASGAGQAVDAHFFVALCSHEPQPEYHSFVYVPRAANMLREREQYVRALENQRDEARRQRDSAMREIDRQKVELEEHNRWASSLNDELAEARRLLENEQREAAATAAAYARLVEQLEAENVSKTEWAQDAEARLKRQIEELVHCMGLLDRAEATVIERTEWAQSEAAGRERLQAMLEAVRASRWVRLGRKVGVGPDLEQA